MSPPTDSPPDSTGPPDRQTLRLLDRHVAADSLVSTTAFEPDSYEPRLLCGRLDVEQYPTSVTAARVEIRWFTTGDFSFQYLETGDTDHRWECRWDQHPNSHNTRLHVHQPPTGTEISDLHMESTHPLSVYSTVFTAIEQRIEQLW